MDSQPPKLSQQQQEILDRMKKVKGNPWVMSNPEKENWEMLKDLESKGFLTSKEIGLTGGSWCFQIKIK